MKKIIIILSLTFSVLSSYSFSGRNILQNEAKIIGLDSLLKNNIQLHNFPKFSDRDFWNAVPENISTQYISEAEKVLDFPWQTIKATDYLEILRTGQRLHEQFILPHNVLRALIMGELVEGKGRFLDQIVNGVWYYCEQTWWGWSAHLKDQREADGLPDVDEPIVDLGAGEIANTMSMAYLLFKDEFDKIHPFISRRVKNEVMKKVIIPFYERDDFWWMGFKPWVDPGEVSPRKLNNWNAWINYNVLLSILILEDDPNKRVKGVNKVIRSLDNLLNTYPEDGGCDEGPNYWKHAGGCVYLSLRLMETTTHGKFNLYDHQLIKNMGSYIYKAAIDYPNFINFADADGLTNLYPNVVYLYGKDINDITMQKFGAYIASKENLKEKAPSGNIDNIILQLKSHEEILNAPSQNPLLGEFWLPNTQLAGARDQPGITRGFYFATKGGYNDESHNHNDVGSFILYFDGKPCFIDIGRETYTAKTFSNKRYEIWNMQSQFHNLPKINGYDQKFGHQYKANNTNFSTTKRKATFTTDISGAYPAEAKVNFWNRSYTLNRGKSFLIEDHFELSETMNGKTSLNFISYCAVKKIEDGVLELTGEDFKLHLQYDAKTLFPAIEFKEVTDPRLFKFWPRGITRIVFYYSNGVMSGRNSIEIKKVL